jgi:hypothetical protein
VVQHAADEATWHVAGSYYEACNCEAICPCRQQGGRPGGRSTYGDCQFALSWSVLEGFAADVDLSGLDAVMVGAYDDHEPGSPWRVALYVDERGTMHQRQALSSIFLGRSGGTALRNFAAAIGEVYAVRPARIELEHATGRQRFRVADHVEVVAREPVVTDTTVTCGIPGHDRAGHELVAEVLRVDEGPLSWEVHGRCSYAATFDYASDVG